jgi:hypothetical protein
LILRSKTTTAKEEGRRGKEGERVQGLFVEGRAGTIGHGETSLLDGLVSVAELGVAVELALRDRLEVLEEVLDGRQFSETIWTLLHVLYDADDRSHLSARDDQRKGGNVVSE